MGRCVPNLPLEERFWSRVDRRGDDECWPYTGPINGDYGAFWVRGDELGTKRGRKKQAHNVAFWLIHGRWPEPMGLHGCDNRVCCNPLNPELERHVHEGTPLKNMQEMIERGRKVVVRTRAKLTDDQAAEIRARWKPGQKPSQTDLAREYGVSQACISFVLLGKTYRRAL